MNHHYLPKILLLLAFLAACSSREGESDRLREIPLEQPFGQASLVRFQVKEKLEKGALPEVEFDRMQVDFGQVLQGAEVVRSFVFRNTGNGALLIKDVRSSCGCTIPQWPEEALAPGERDTIFVRFDTEGRFGDQQKVITLTTNAQPAEYRLLLKGRVLETQQEH